MVEFGREPQDSANDGFDPELDSNFEQELRARLQPLPAPEGFTDRVLARVESLSRPVPLPWRTRTVRNLRMRGAIAAMLLLTVSLGGYFEHQRQRQIAGEHARQQVLLALRITSSTLQDVRNKVDGDNATHENTN
jgi:hypothetical protein